MSIEVTLYDLGIVVIEGNGVDGSQVAWFPLTSPGLPVGHTEPQPQLGNESDCIFLLKPLALYICLYFSHLSQKAPELKKAWWMWK